MGLAFPILSEDFLTEIAGDINNRGFGVARNCISPTHLQSLRTFVENKVAENGGEYIVFVGAEPVRGTLLEDLSSCPEFMQACQKIYEKGTGETAPAAPFYHILRCLSGKTGEKESFRFHYDSNVVTVLIPIVIPTEGKTGDLIMLPNSRRLRKSYLRNVIDKVLLDNKLQFLLRNLIAAGLLKVTKIRLSPGSFYFFWGYRSIHANEACDPDKIRATAIFHYLNPHAASRLREALRPDNLHFGALVPKLRQMAVSRRASTTAE